MRGQEHVKKSSYNIREKKRPKPDGGADPEEHILHMSLQSKHNIPLELKSYCAGKVSYIIWIFVPSKSLMEM